MKLVAFLRRIGRRLEPPGNRGSLDTSYRQPRDQGPNTRSWAAGSMTERR
jgi:hypothetical protein